MHIKTMGLSASDEDELRGALREMTTANSGKTDDSGVVRPALARILTLVAKAGETVVTVGIRAVVENFMRQHGMVP